MGKGETETAERGGEERKIKRESRESGEKLLCLCVSCVSLEAASTASTPLFHVGYKSLLTPSGRGFGCGKKQCPTALAHMASLAHCSRLRCPLAPRSTWCTSQRMEGRPSRRTCIASAVRWDSAGSRRWGGLAGRTSAHTARGGTCPRYSLRQTFPRQERNCTGPRRTCCREVALHLALFPHRSRPLGSGHNHRDARRGPPWPPADTSSPQHPRRARR